MKKIFSLMALCAMTLVANAATYNYLCAITDIEVDTLASTTKNQYIITFEQTYKNTAEYDSKPTTVYTSTVKIYLNSDDRTLDGVYTTEGADRYKNDANVNDQTINMVKTEFTSGSTSRILHRDSTSTFVIKKAADGRYYIDECTLYFSQRTNQTDTRTHHYCYAIEDIYTKGISPTPYYFEYSDGDSFTEIHTAYDVHVTGLSMQYSLSDYGEHRYFLTMACSGTNRTNGEVRNYEVQLALYSEGEEPSSIVGSYATQNGNKLLWAPNCYVKDLNADKQRNLANDSISSVRIESKGNNKYRFTGGPLICTDMDLNYFQVYQVKRITETHYYYFSDNDGQGIDFSFDGENIEIINNPQGIEDAIEGNVRSTKVIRDGQLYIEKNGILYNAQGAVVK